jgi:hypothetical protein
MIGLALAVFLLAHSAIPSLAVAGDPKHTAPPVTGGVMLAMEQVGWASTERRAHLLQSIGDFMQENLESA